jgi:hypothetical protein
VTWLIVAYVAVGWLAFVEGMRTAATPSDVAGAVLEAALWPLVVVLALIGVAIDVVRTGRTL